MHPVAKVDNFRFYLKLFKVCFERLSFFTLYKIGSDSVGIFLVVKKNQLTLAKFNFLYHLVKEAINKVNQSKETTAWLLLFLGVL